MSYVQSKDIILDLGEWSIKVGFNTDASPRISLLNVLAYNRYYSDEINFAEAFGRPYFVGQEAIESKYSSDFIFPLVNQDIKDRDALEKVLHHLLLGHLKVNTTEQNLVLLTSPLTPRYSLEQYIEIFFEIFGVPKLYLLTTAEANLLLSRKRTGVVVELGYNSTYLTPFYRNHIISHLCNRTPLAGEKITEQFKFLLHQKGYWYKSRKEFFLINDLKEEYCYIALYPILEKKAYSLNPSLKREFTFPDGTKVVLAEERFLAPEILFNPMLAHLSHESIVDEIISIIEQSDTTIRGELIQNIIVAGGTSAIPGFVERLQKELSENLSVDSRVFAHPSRSYGAWLGVKENYSSIRRLSGITRRAYMEYGTTVLELDKAEE